MENELMNIKNNSISIILEASDETELEEIRIQFLGRNGMLTQAMKQIVKLPAEQKREIGMLANEIKSTIEATLEDRKKSLHSKKITLKSKKLDVTEPGIKPTLGHLHLVSQAVLEITAIFTRIGFTRVEYPEAEWDYYAFTGLNFPENHPARDDWETFFIDQEEDSKYGQVVLTPHTSSGQVREIEKEALLLKKNKNHIVEIKMLNIGKCYRRQSDVSHTQMFHQFEGLVVGKNISITNLKGTLDYFVKSYFGKDRDFRIRPYHFQFTEPSFEIDVSCGICLGKGILNDNTVCRLCKAGWLEMGGAGMVHPNVLKMGGLDPEIYNGFAFGWGVERVLMMKDDLRLDDIRLLYSNNLDFLNQF